jgi:hypothetical protein
MDIKIHPWYFFTCDILSVNWQPKHITIRFLEAINTIAQSLTKTWIALLEKYDLEEKIIAYVKDERFNLNIMILQFRVNCKLQPFGFGRKVIGHLFWSCIFLSLPICYNLWKKMWKLDICIYQGYIKGICKYL